MEKSKSMMVWRTLLVLFIAFLWGGGIGAHAENKAWAKFDSSAGTLTFYYGEKESLGDDEYGMNDKWEKPSWASTMSSVRKVVFDESFSEARPVSCYWWFTSFEKLSAIEGIENLNTSQVTNMNCMFYYCTSLESLDLSSFETHKVENMTGMFQGCKSLATIYASDDFMLKKGIVGERMFLGCSNLHGDNISYDSSKIGVEYANIEGGYFTPKGDKGPWGKIVDGVLTIRYGYKPKIRRQYFLCECRVKTAVLTPFSHFSYVFVGV